MATIDELFPEKQKSTTDIDALFPEKKPAEKPAGLGVGFTDIGIGIGEAATAIGSGVAGEIAGGWRGLAGMVAGQSPEQSAAIVKETQDFMQYVPKTEEGQQYLESVGNAFDTLSRAAKFFPSVARGVGSYFAGDGFKKGFEDVQNTPFSQMTGDAAFDVTGSPAVGAITQGLAEVGADLIPAAGGAKTAQGAINRTVRRADDAVAEAEQAVTRAGRYEPEISEESVRQTVEQVQTGKPEDIAAMIDADPEILTAIDDLGIKADPIYSQVSRNPQYREVEGGLKSMPGSALKQQELEFINATKAKADDLITSYGGTRDKAFLSQQFETDMLQSVDDLREASDRVYGALDENVKKSEQAVSSSTMSFIMSQADELGGIDKLPGRLKSLYSKLRSKEKEIAPATRKTDPVTMLTRAVPAEVESINPTIGQIDYQRKAIGQALGKKSGPFADMEEGQLKKLYSTLTDDMNRILEEKGFKELSDEAKRLTIDRKTLEGNMQSLLGNKLQKDLMDSVTAATKGLTKNKTKQFIETMKKIPTEYRQQAAVSALNDIFRGAGQGMESFNANSYLKFWNELSAQPAAKAALMKELPKGLPEALESMAKIAKGINQAERTTITTGRLNSFFQPNTGMVSKLLGNVGRTLAASKAGPAGSALYNAASEFLNQSSSPAKAAAALIAKPQFQDTIRKAINERINNPQAASEALKRAENDLMATKEYRDWLRTLDKSSRVQATAGFLGYMLAEGTENDQRNNIQ